MTDAEFYDFIITPNAKWPEEMSLSDQLQKISDCMYITETMRSIPYQTFLKTPYWETVSKYLLRRKSCECELCAKSSVGLKLLRKAAYGYGREYSPHDYGDFIALCPKCYDSINKHLPEIKANTEYEIDSIIRNYK